MWREKARRGSGIRTRPGWLAPCQTLRSSTGCLVWKVGVTPSCAVGPAPTRASPRLKAGVLSALLAESSWGHLEPCVGGGGHPPGPPPAPSVPQPTASVGWAPSGGCHENIGAQLPFRDDAPDWGSVWQAGPILRPQRLTPSPKIGPGPRPRPFPGLRLPQPPRQPSS